jgi:hypothetical protein
MVPKRAEQKFSPLLLLIFTCKSGGFESGPDETQTCDLCHAQVAL